MTFNIVLHSTSGELTGDVGTGRLVYRRGVAGNGYGEKFAEYEKAGMREY